MEYDDLVTYQCLGCAEAIPRGRERERAWGGKAAAFIVLSLLACSPSAPLERPPTPAGPSRSPVATSPSLGCEPGCPAPAAADTPASEPRHGWTAGIVDLPTTRSGMAQLRAIRAARHEGQDRVVFEFEGEGVPGLHAEYVDRPVRRCGSGEVVDLPGEGWLMIRLEPAAAHDEAGASTLAWREKRVALGVVEEIALVCDFEGQTAAVLAVASPQRFRVRALEEPARLVVDVRH